LGDEWPPVVQPAQHEHRIPPEEDLRHEARNSDMRRLQAWFLILMALCTHSWPARAQECLTVPLADHVKDGRRVGYWLEVQAAAGQSGMVLLDTGSRGLMLMADRLEGGHVSRTGRHATQIFLDGTVFEGEIVLAVVRIGPVATVDPVPVLAVKNISCKEGRPDCPGRHLFNSPLAGILGVGFGDARFMDTPLSHLPGNLAGGFIIHGGGHNGPAGLILGLTPLSRRGFVFPPAPRKNLPAPTGGSLYDWNAVFGCFSISGSSERYFCGDMLFDTGSSRSFLHVPPPLPEGIQPDGDLDGSKVVTLAIPGLPEYRTTTGQRPWADHFKVVADKTGQSIISAGFFTDFDVLYDLKRQSIGIRPAF